MKVLGIAGHSDTGKTTLVEALADRLSTRGTVATVKHLGHAPDVDTEGKDTARHRAAGATTTVGITDDEGWFATGADRSLDDALDRLAPAHDYALVEGYADEGLPKVVLGDADAAPPVLLREPDADAVAVDDVLAEFEDAEPFETLDSLVERARRTDGAEHADAVAAFSGRVRREDSPDEAPTEFAEAETGERVAAIREELLARDGVHDALFHSRRGVTAASEDVVLAVVLAGSRSEAFRAVESGVDRVAQAVPLSRTNVTVEDGW